MQMLLSNNGQLLSDLDAAFVAAFLSSKFWSPRAYTPITWADFCHLAKRRKALGLPPSIPKAAFFEAEFCNYKRNYCKCLYS